MSQFDRSRLLLPSPSSFRPLHGSPVAVFDTETTGTDPRSARVVQVSVVHLTLGDDSPQVVFQSLVNPGGPIPAGASRVHGIRDQDVATAPPFSVVARELVGALSGRWLAAYNLPYDWTILDAEFQRAGLNVGGWAFQGIDPLPCVRFLDRNVRPRPSHKLGDVAPRFGVDLGEDAHDATADALATARILDPVFRTLDRDPGCPHGTLGTFRRFFAWLAQTASRCELDLKRWATRKGIDKFQDTPWTDLARPA